MWLDSTNITYIEPFTLRDRRSLAAQQNNTSSLFGWVIVLAVLSLWIALGPLPLDVMTTLLLTIMGAAVGISIVAYISVRETKRIQARRAVIFLLGSLLFSLVIVTDHGNMQIEGLFFGLLTSVTHFAVIHYLIAKIAGPVIFGRVWCGWACWYAMLFDQLPFKANTGRIPGPWGRLRYFHFVLSLCLVLLLWFALNYRSGLDGLAGMTWFLGGYFLYILLGIGMAFALRDNRAFCKYLCPITVPLKAGARLALLKIDGVAERCDSCDACIKICPMNIRVPEYILAHERVLSTECTLCQACINVCSRDALKLSFKMDVGGKELLEERAPRIGRRRRSAVPQGATIEPSTSSGL